LGILAHLYTDYKFLEYWDEYLQENKGSYYSILILENRLLFDKFRGSKQKILSYLEKTSFSKYGATQKQVS